MKRQINEIKKMQLLAGLITESEYRKTEETVNERYGFENDDLIYDNMLSMDIEQLISDMLSTVESDPSTTLKDYLLKYDSSMGDDNGDFDNKEGIFNESIPDWNDYEGYEMLLEKYFDLEEVTDKRSLEIAMDNDLVHNLATDILERKGIQTPNWKDYDAYDSFQDSQEKREATILATEFIIQFAEDTFIIDEQEAKELTSNYLSWANK
jgi:hypothetical protein